jgi:1-acyl-sn-glycerol-3-phosphate acyltransferase
VHAITRPIAVHLYRLQIEGLEHVPTTGGFVVAANHTSNVDPWPIGIALYPRQLHFMAKQELWKPVLRTLMGALGSFPVRRGEIDLQAVKTAVAICRSGAALAMFPEGTRRHKGMRKTRQATPHTGTARIALRAGVPILPAAIHGTDRLTRLGPLRVRFGAPIEVADLAGQSARDAATTATDRLWAEIERLEALLAAEP